MTAFLQAIGVGEDSLGRPAPGNIHGFLSWEIGARGYNLEGHWMANIRVHTVDLAV